MNKKHKMLDVVLWAVVGLAILSFVGSIAIGHATDYTFLNI